MRFIKKMKKKNSISQFVSLSEMIFVVFFLFSFVVVVSLFWIAIRKWLNPLSALQIIYWCSKQKYGHKRWNYYFFFSSYFYDKNFSKSDAKRSHTTSIQHVQQIVQNMKWNEIAEWVQSVKVNVGTFVFDVFKRNDQSKLK